MKGFVQVYTGHGKGKTTAALGLSLRAAGAGLNVFFGQFMKKRETAEAYGISLMGPGITLEQFGARRFIGQDISEEDKKEAENGLNRVREVLGSGKFSIVVLDEINVALGLGLLSVESVLDIIEHKPDGTELILTGRNAPERIKARADLVTEMVPVKHYLKTGVKARKGIEF